MSTWQVLEDLVFCRLQALVCWWPAERFRWVGEPLSSFTSRLVSVCGLLFTPGRFLEYLYVGLDCEHSFSWHFDTPSPNSIRWAFIICQDFATLLISCSFSYICCADLMEESPWNTEESSIAVFHWCEDRDEHFWVIKALKAVWEGDALGLVTIEMRNLIISDSQVELCELVMQPLTNFEHPDNIVTTLSDGAVL